MRLESPQSVNVHSEDDKNRGEALALVLRVCV